MIVLSCNNVSKAYVVDNVIENISFILNDNEKVGLIGLNGAGKSTLFNILTDKLEADSGEVFKAKGKKIGYLKQNISIENNNTIMEEVMSIFDDIIKLETKLHDLSHEISSFKETDNQEELSSIMDEYFKLNEKFEEMGGFIFKSKIRGVLRGLGFSDEDFQKHILSLSGGQKSRVMLAKLLLEDADILLLDEPTNHLDINSISWLERYIKDFNGAAIIISHDRYFLDNTVNKIFLMENKNLKSYNGNYSEFIKKRKTELEQSKKQYEEYERDISKQEEMIRRLHSYGSKRNIRQAFSRQNALDKIKKIDKPQTDNKKLNLRFSPQVKSGRDVLKCRDLSLSYNDKEIFNNASFDIYRGEKVGIIGPNGIGKTSLLRIINNNITSFFGDVELGHHVNIGYYDQEQENLDEESTVIDEIWDYNPTMNYYEIRTLLAQFLFFGDDIYKIVGELSGGEKSRLSLLKLMTSKSNFLLMDEPTNHLDIDSKEVLEDALLNYDGTILVVSHDRYFLNKIASKILEMNSNEIFEYLGNYEYFVQKKSELDEKDDEIIQELTKTQINAIKKKERETIRDRQKKDTLIKNLEKEIEQTELKISEIEHTLCLPSTYNNKDLIMELNESLNISKEYLDKLYNEWSLLLND